MNTYKTVKRGAFLLGFLVSSYSLNALNFNAINFNEIFQKAKGFVDQISISQDPEATKNHIFAVAQKTFENLPSEILGVDITQFKRGEIDPAVLENTQKVINEAVKYLPKVTAFLSNPELTMTFIADIAYPKLKDVIGENRAGIRLLSAMQDFISFAEEKPEAINNLSARITALLKALQTGLKGLSGTKLKKMSLSAIPEKFKELEAEASKQYPDVIRYLEWFVNENKNALQKIFVKISEMNLSVDLQGLLQEAKDKLKDAGVSSALGL